MVIVFTFGFFQFAKFSSVMDSSGMALLVTIDQASEINKLVATGGSKINFAEGNPKLFLQVDTIPASLKVTEGVAVLQDNEIILGASEAAMMKRLGLIKGVGDSLNDFFGLKSAKIVGILAPTNTMIDEYHLVNKNTFASLQNVAKLQYVAEKEIIKEFYTVTDKNMPEKFAGIIGNFNLIEKNGKKYKPVYIGSAEAQMMINKKLISKDGDTIDNLFGNDVIVAKILSKTKTSMDMMHFVGPDFIVKE